MSQRAAYSTWGEPTLRVTLMPRDTNAWGTIFGGVILSYIDMAGGVEARKHGGHTYVTIAMREVVFHQPVYVGDLVSFYTRTERVGRTSVTVKVMVEAERVHEGGKRVKVTEAEAVYVAVDDNRRPIPVVREPARSSQRSVVERRAATGVVRRKPRRRSGVQGGQ